MTKINSRSQEISRFSPARMLPSVYFYLKTTTIVFRAAAQAKKGVYADKTWIQDSCRIISLLQDTGCRFEVTGQENLEDIPQPRVYVANHMSTLETFVFPCLLKMDKKLTYVVKKGLVQYPVFKHIMFSRDPVVVGRKNPREDFKTVISEGVKRLNAGISIIIFPQTTRSSDFHPAQFNSMGIKLAKRAGVPAVPVALKTDAWSTGRILKDYGRIIPSRVVRFAFAPAMTVAGSGKEEHEKCVEFISERIKTWKEATG